MGHLEKRLLEICEKPTIKWLNWSVARKKIIDAGLVVVYSEKVIRKSGDMDTYLKMISPFKLDGFIKENEFSGDDRVVSMRPFGFGNIFSRSAVSALQINIESFKWVRIRGVRPIFLSENKIPYELTEIWKPNWMMGGAEVICTIFDANDMRKWSIKQLDLTNKAFMEATNKTKEIFK